MWQAPWKIPHTFLTDYWRNESRVKFCEILLNHLSGNLNFHFFFTSGFLHCLKQPTWSWRIKLMHKFHWVAMRITLGKWEDEGQRLSQRVNSPSTNGFLSWKNGRWYILQHYGIPRQITPKFSDKWKQKNYIKQNIHLLEANFFSAFSSAFFSNYFLCSKITSPCNLRANHWRFLEVSRPLIASPQLGCTSCPSLDVLFGWEMASAAGQGASFRCHLGFPMPTVQH